MTAYLIKRLLQIIPTLLGITFITFVIIQLAPGNPAMLKLQMGKGEADAWREGYFRADNPADKRTLRLGQAPAASNISCG